MATRRKKNVESTPLFSVGDAVEFVFGRRISHAVVTEDRGLLGRGGRRLYQIQIPMDPSFGDVMTFEMPEDELTLSPAISAAP